MNSPCRRFDLLFSPCWFNLSLLNTLTARVLVRHGRSITSESGVTPPFHSIETCARMALRDSLINVFRVKKKLGRIETRTRDRLYYQTMRTVRDISRDDRRIATCSLWTLTDRQTDRLNSRVKLLHDPNKIARKRFMAFLCSLRSIVKLTKSRHHSDHQKVFKSDF